jgi:hypothetical protein
MFGSFLPSLRSLSNHSLLGSRSRHCYAIKGMLNYPFPYEKPDVTQSFASLRDLLLSAVNETDKEKFAMLAKQYIRERQKYLTRLSSDDHKHLSLQLWQEGIAAPLESETRT